jgi:hypothetical protein
MSRPLITAKAEKLRRLQLNTVLDWLEANGGGGGGSSAWGGITGTLSAQTDLQTALNAKADATATSTALSGKQATILAGTATVTVANNAIEVSQTVAAVGVTGSSRVFASLGAMADSAENDAEMLDVLSLAAVPGADVITFDMAFASPQSGAIPINWSVI